VDMSGPVVNVLRLSDGDIPSAGKIYLEMYNMGQKLEHIIMQDATQRLIKKEEGEEVRETVCKKSFVHLNYLICAWYNCFQSLRCLCSK